jgi:hypothetical protein
LHSAGSSSDILINRTLNPPYLQKNKHQGAKTNSQALSTQLTTSLSTTSNKQNNQDLSDLFVGLPQHPQKLLRRLHVVATIKVATTLKHVLVVTPIGTFDLGSQRTPQNFNRVNVVFLS